MISDMITWFGQYDPVLQAAIITGIASIIVAVITGIFKLVTERLTNKKNKDKERQSSINIKQSTTGSNNTFIGIQNNKEDRHE